MELIERYVVEVGRHLPQKQRTDVQTELRSLLEDMVEDRAQTKVDKADEAVVVEVLREFGHPKIVAASYQPLKQYLIGPQLFSTFKMVLIWVTVVLGAIALFDIMSNVWRSDVSLLAVTQQIVWAIPDFIDSILSALGSMVVIFYLVERVLPDEVPDEKAKEWDPRSLPAVNDNQAFDRSELVASIVFTAIFLMVIQEPQSSDIPLFAPNFYANLLTWVNVLLLSSIGLDIYKLRLGRRTRTSQVLDIGMALFTAVIAFILIQYGPVFEFNREIIEANVPAEGVEVIFYIFGWVKLILPIIIIAELLSAAKKIYDFRRIPKNEAMPTLVNRMG